MSTHVLDVSGARPLSICINDPARTGANVSAKAGDDVVIQASGREVRLQLPANARLQRRRYVTRTHAKDEAGKIVKDEAGEYVYEEKPYEALVVVLPGSVTLFARTSVDPDAPVVAEGDPPVYEQTPHTSLSARRWTDLHFLESGDLLEERELQEFLPALDAETLAKIPTK